jgi:hypothetical protein
MRNIHDVTQQIFLRVNGFIRLSLSSFHERGANQAA